MKRYPLLACAVLVGLLSLWGCKDGNLFGGFRKEGSGDTATKLADARAALARKEFNNARAYYESILASDPRNSQALYGAASATMGSSGLDLGTLLSNIITTNGAPAAGSSSLGDVIRSAAIGAGASSVDPNSLLDGLNIDALKSNLNIIICYLSRIRVGNSDGVIPTDDVSTLLSLMITRTLRAVLRVQDLGLIDIRKTSSGNSYNVEITGNVATLNSYCGDIGAGSQIEKALDDLAGAVNSLNAVVAKLNSSADSTLTSIKTDVDNAFNEFKSEVAGTAGLSNGCKNLLNNKYPTPSAIPSPTTEDCSDTGVCCQ